MPGVPRLSAELGIDRKTVDAALRLLDGEGLLVPRGVGRRRRIAPSGHGAEGNRGERPLRVAILGSEPEDTKLSYMVDLHHKLLDLGHEAFHADRFLVELGMDVRRIQALVEKTAADAWIVGAASREVLEWFARRPEPTFAIFGRYDGLPLAGTKPDKLPAMAAALRRLSDIGHRRFVMVTRGRRRLPEPGKFEQHFLDELEARGIPTSSYNLPDWDETPAGLRQLMHSLFEHTPPTALILDEAPFFAAAQHFLAERGVRVPGEVSLVCADPDPSFSWCVPPVSHIHWNPNRMVGRIVRWARNVSRGRKDRGQTPTSAKFIEGGTIGPVAV